MIALILTALLLIVTRTTNQRNAMNATYALLIASALAAGCASPGLSADQLKAAASDKNASAVCSKITTMGGNGTVVSVNLDKTVIPNGSVTVTGDCVVTITTEQSPKPAPK